MFCTNCGEEITDESKFCKNCGSPIEPEEEEVTDHSYENNAYYDNNAYYEDNSKKGLIKKIGIIAVIIIILAVAVGVLFNTGLLTPKTNHEFKYFDLKLPNDYQVNYADSDANQNTTVTIIDGKGMEVGTVSNINLYFNETLNEQSFKDYVGNNNGRITPTTIGSHNGYISQKTNDNGKYDGIFIFEVNGIVYEIDSKNEGSDSQYAGSYDCLKTIAEGFTAKKSNDTFSIDAFDNHKITISGEGTYELTNSESHNTYLDYSSYYADWDLNNKQEYRITLNDGNWYDLILVNGKTTATDLTKQEYSTSYNGTPFLVYASSGDLYGIEITASSNKNKYETEDFLKSIISIK